MEKRYIRADGRVVWAISDVSLVRSAKEEPSHFVCQFQDITERKLAEEALRQSEERFRGAFENASTGVALVNLDNRYLRVNSALCKMPRLYRGRAHWKRGLSRSPTTTIR